MYQIITLKGGKTFPIKIMLYGAECFLFSVSIVTRGVHNYFH